MRTEVVDRWGDDVTATLDAVSARLTTDVLRRLNAAAAGITRRRRRAPGSERRAWREHRRAHDRRRRSSGAARTTGPAGPTTARRTGRHRRPSGAAPPLPRSLGSTGKGLLVVLAALLIWVIVAAASPAARRVTDQLDAFVLRLIAHLRTPWLTTVFRGIDRIGIGWLLTVASLLLIVALIVLRRWRHLFTFLGSVLVARARCVGAPEALRAPPSLRRHDHRSLEGLLVALGARGGRDHRPRRRRLHAGRCRRARRRPRSCSSRW